MDTIDAIIAEATQPAAESAQPEKVDAPQPTEENKQQPTEENTEHNEQGKSDDDVVFPKKAVNAISRRDKQIGKLRAELAAERAAKTALEKQYTPPQQAVQQKQVTDSNFPKEAEYKTYAEYLEAVTDYKINLGLEQHIAKLQENQKETERTTQEQAWFSQRQNTVSQQAAEFIKENPEALALVQEYADIADEFPAHIQRAFLEADNAPLAFYNLAKEGKLEALASMSPAKAAMEIGRAQAQAPSKPKTKAPPPLPASRGSAAPSKPLDSMSGHELLKWVNSK